MKVKIDVVGGRVALANSCVLGSDEVTIYSIVQLSLLIERNRDVGNIDYVDKKNKKQLIQVDSPSAGVMKDFL